MITFLRKQLGTCLFQRRAASILLGLGTAAGLTLGVSGCGGGGGRPNSIETSLNTISGEKLGALIAQGGQLEGEVVLVHLSGIPGQSAQWIDGLKKGLDGKANITELGPTQLPDEAKATMGGFGALKFALQQHPDAAAIITTLPVGAYERPSFTKGHPPIYALGWGYLPDSIHLFKGKHMVGGIFAHPVLPTTVDSSSSMTDEELFDRNFVVVTPENLREIASQFN